MGVEELVVKNIGWIRNKARHYCDNGDDADDLAGETICKCLSNARRFDTSMSFRPWALAIMANTYITRYNRRRCVLFTGIDGHDTYSCERADQRAAVRRLLSVIRRTARTSRSVESVLLYARGYSYDEIAAMEGIPVGTVKSRVATGRRLLRRTLER